MINRILMELYDDYIENSNVDKLWSFAQKTFPADGTDKLFVGCVLILFSIAGGYKPRYFCTRENLESVMLLAKNKIGDNNLLAFYIDRVNKAEGVNKYLNEVVNDSNLEKYADIILSYLNQFKLDFVSQVRQEKSLGKYIKSIEEKI